MHAFTNQIIQISRLLKSGKMRLIQDKNEVTKSARYTRIIYTTLDAT